MLAERVKEWTHQWKQEGRLEGLREGQDHALEKARAVLLRDLEKRFGPLPKSILQRVEAVASIEELTELTLRAGAASSLTVLADGQE